MTMKRRHLLFLALTVIAVGPVRQLAAHCEVPCGIYGDQRRFEELLEDQMTIAKAITSINDLASKGDALSHNQLARWVVTKESHATNIQHIIAQYFMTQRIKPGTDDATQQAYVKKLTAAHAVMVAAMKSKQTVDAASATALRDAILDFYRAYEGKEPQLETQ
jgi:nickel superoxide dismutase